MNLLQVIQAMEATASVQPPVASVVRNDIYRLNSIPAARYGVFAWLQGEHRTALDSSLQEFSFTLFYVDRLTFNKDNEIQIQSQGIEVLENILGRLAEVGIVAGEHTFRTFNERFADECAGVYCSVTLEAPKDGTCPEDFVAPYFSLDFNNDYAVIKK